SDDYYERRRPLRDDERLRRLSDDAEFERERLENKI
ncbi:unnamed protein product, partial [Rotaria sp. Silwood2]